MIGEGALHCRWCGGLLPFGPNSHCFACGITTRTPQPSEERLAEIYGSAYYQSWGTDYWPLKRRLFQELVRRAAAPSGRALDVGCATGACLSVLVESGFAATGIDINPHAVEQARRAVPNAQVVLGTIEQAGFADSTFSLVVLSDVVEHALDPDGLLAEVARVLAPGGRVVVLTPDLNSWSRKVLGARWPHFKEEHLYLFTRRAMRNLLERAGLDSVRIGPGLKWLSVAYAVSQFQAYPMPLVTPLARAVNALLPPILSRQTFPVPMGEMIATASRPGP